MSKILYCGVHLATYWLRSWPATGQVLSHTTDRLLFVIQQGLIENKWWWLFKKLYFCKENALEIEVIDTNGPFSNID